MYDIHVAWLKKWIEPFIKELNFTNHDLQIFLPGSAKDVGDVWDMVIPITSKYGKENRNSTKSYVRDFPLDDLINLKKTFTVILITCLMNS